MHADSIATREAIGSELIRLAVRVSGVVQGVGFRPFVYSLATRLSLAGFVRNAGGTVEIEIEGQRLIVQEFLQSLRNERPPLAAIHEVDVVEIPCALEPILEFSIDTSAVSAVSTDAAKAVPADSATCDQCLQELFDAADRRYRYPFINCTNCGPRFTIIKSLPYDRPTTTMADFKMCSLCRSEYDDPGNRRFHAQPNACPRCGPSLTFMRSEGIEASHVDTNAHGSEDALHLAVDLLQKGNILAVKGLGGFHLMCDARNEKAVCTLRQRKQRYGKPLAVMMSSPALVRQFCRMSREEEALLLRPSRPIVLLRKLLILSASETPAGNDREVAALCPGNDGIAPSVAPAIDHLGVMLPYTPLHHLLLADFQGPLVATSGNRSDEPIAIANEEAMSRLSGIADAFLVHDREIESRYDDSVSRIFQSSEIIIRRSRGYAPLPITLPVRATAPVLACGGHLKNTFCLITNDKAFVSQHIGDLDDLDGMRHFQESLARFKNLFSIEPEIVAHDLHPDYLSTALAQEIASGDGLPKVAVQHHHAHIASCMAEHGLMDPVIGVAFDGLGYGLDGTAWGGEFLVCDWKNIERRGYFEPVAMPGGQEAIKRPWRMALGYHFSNQQACGPVFQGFVDAMSKRYGTKAVSVIRQQVEKQFNAPMTSSCGRLFDAMSALLGVCLEAAYEGQAAMELEAQVDLAFAEGALAGSPISVNQLDAYPYELGLVAGKLVVSPHSILGRAMDDLSNGQSSSRVAARFHSTLARIVLDVCCRIRVETGLKQVCLSGGVFQNALLLRLAVHLLGEAGFQVFYPRRLPANDGGLSLGQAVIALAKVNALGCRSQVRS